MKKKFRIKKNEEFQLVFHEGESFANRQFVVYILPKKDQDFFRIGLSVSKKIGNAVTRVRIKRYIRQAFLELNDQVKKQSDYVIIARKPASEMEFHEVKSSLIHVLKRGKALKSLPKKDKHTS
ncbi:ribonuclease P protein component [Bacillus sp. 1P06AnD]|uniref:ribonuclease P protein component n=1 Tax=Bacillus sp. 1P06AnD TaxID=3132208 RepID=UPI0039A2216B